MDKRFGLGLLLVFFSSVSWANDDMMKTCIDRINISANSKAVIQHRSATGVFMSHTLGTSGAIRTQDGTNKVKRIWVNRKSPFHWGSSKTIAYDAGPTFIAKNRTNTAGYIVLSMRVEAGDSPTEICLCSSINADDDVELSPTQMSDLSRKMDTCRKEKGL